MGRFIGTNADIGFSNSVFVAAKCVFVPEFGFLWLGIFGGCLGRRSLFVPEKK